jgi:hypothetical protein
MNLMSTAITDMNPAASNAQMMPREFGGRAAQVVRAFAIMPHRPTAGDEQ